MTVPQKIRRWRIPVGQTGWKLHRKFSQAYSNWENTQKKLKKYQKYTKIQKRANIGPEKDPKKVKKAHENGSTHELGSMTHECGSFKLVCGSKWLKYPFVGQMTQVVGQSDPHIKNYFFPLLNKKDAHFPSVDTQFRDSWMSMRQRTPMMKNHE